MAYSKQKSNPSRVVALSIALALLIQVGFIWLISQNLSASPKETNTSTSNSSPAPAEHNHQAAAAKIDPVNMIDLTNEKSVGIEIKDYAYAKKDIKVKKGTVVIWINQDTVEHNVMAAHDHDEEAHGAIDHDEANPTILNGPLLALGESYSFAFNEVGTFAYHCAPHPSMTGSVTVVE